MCDVPSGLHVWRSIRATCVMFHPGYMCDVPSGLHVWRRCWWYTTAAPCWKPAWHLLYFPKNNYKQKQCDTLQHFAKWFIFLHLKQSLSYALHFLGWCRSPHLLQFSALGFMPVLLLYLLLAYRREAGFIAGTVSVWFSNNVLRSKNENCWRSNRRLRTRSLSMPCSATLKSSYGHTVLYCPSYTPWQNYVAQLRCRAYIFSGRYKLSGWRFCACAINVNHQCTAKRKAFII